MKLNITRDLVLRTSMGLPSFDSVRPRLHKQPTPCVVIRNVYIQSRLLRRFGVAVEESVSTEFQTWVYRCLQASVRKVCDKWRGNCFERSCKIRLVGNSPRLRDI